MLLPWQRFAPLSANYAIVAVSCKYGFGRHTIYVSSKDRSTALFYFFLQTILWYWGMAAMKISVAFLLLRMQYSTTWKRILWTMISFQVLVATFAAIWAFTFCIPTRSLWESVPTAKCGSTYASHVFGYVYTSISMTSDLFLSLMPLTFIWHLRRPRLEKVVVGMLMCLGLTATTAATKRLVDMAYQNFSGDVLHDLPIPNMWCMLEEVIGVAAVSIPYLKAPMERTLERLGLLLVLNNHQSSLSDVSCPPDCIGGVEEALVSGDAVSNVGSFKHGKAEFELTQTPQVASGSQ
ncbi:hypothetical protein ACJBU6_03110 [Exserohilum turcicum]